MSPNQNPDFPLRSKKAQSTRQRILDVATELFLTEGFSQTSLARVAEVAETTKPTVYSHFKSKTGLFDAIINQHAEARIQVLNELLIPTDNPEEDLIRFGDVFMPVILTEQSCWDRLAAAESMIHPEVGEAFFNAGPARVIKKLKDYLAHQHQVGHLQVEKPARAAEQLIGLMLGIDLLRAQVGKKPPSRAALKTKCREAVTLFLATYGLANE